MAEVYLPQGAKTDSRGFSDTASDRVLIYHFDHVNDAGAGTIWGVLLADGYAINCGIGAKGEARAKDIQAKMNAALATPKTEADHVTG